MTTVIMGHSCGANMQGRNAYRNIVSLSLVRIHLQNW